MKNFATESKNSVTDDFLWITSVVEHRGAAKIPGRWSALH